jgi:hypothetical protein
MTIVLRLDQHRAQITAEWVDTVTGEVSRSRIAPAHRESVRRFLARFEGLELEVALEATTGWRFVVEELHRVGARVHLAEPAETAARRGRKKRAKTDRADARLLRELVMVGRLPESWIAPDHILDLRARAVAPYAHRRARGVAAADTRGDLPPRRPQATSRLLLRQCTCGRKPKQTHRSPDSARRSAGLLDQNLTTRSGSGRRSDYRSTSEAPICRDFASGANPDRTGDPDAPSEATELRPSARIGSRVAVSLHRRAP